MIKTRIVAAKKKQKIAEQQIEHHRNQIEKLLNGSQEFQDQYEELLAAVLV